MKTQRCKKRKGDRCNLMMLLYPKKKYKIQTNKHPLMQTVFFLLTTYYYYNNYNDLKAAVKYKYSQAFNGTCTLITVCSWDSIAVIRCSQCEIKTDKKPDL